MPRVSVALSVYNTNETYLRECIDSILNQTFTDFELLIQNDASTDERVEQVILSYGDDRIKYQKNERNLGISGTRNALIKRAEGEYIAVMDHDDVCLPTRFEKQVAFLDAHPEVGVLGSWYETFPKVKLKKKPLKSDEIKAALFYSCPILQSCMMMRKSLGACYNEHFPVAEDLEMYCGLIEKTAFANLPEVLVRYRGYEGNTSQKTQKKMAELSKILRAGLCKKHPRLYLRSIADRIKNKLLRLTGIK